MNRICTLLLTTVFSIISTICFADWENSPNNWENSSNNWENSSNNWKNSPNNWENSSSNSSSKNGVYDNQGNRRGYAVPRQSGSGVNYFDNEGNRTGYHNY